MTEILPINAESPKVKTPRGITIPRQLSNEKFITLKGYIDSEKEPLYRWKLPENQLTADQIHDWIDGEHADFNYGVVYESPDLMLIDADDISKPEAIKLLEELPRTFTLMTGRVSASGVRNGRHVYLRIKGDVPERFLRKKLTISTTSGEELGDIRLPKSPFYNVAPGSLHASGHRYEPINHLEIAYIEFDALIRILDRCGIKYVVAKDNIDKPRTVTLPDGTNRPVAFAGEFLSEYKVNIFDFIKVKGKWTKWSDGSRWLEGENPMLGSSNGHNLAIKEDGLVFVDRHNKMETGGLPLAILFTEEIRTPFSDYSPITKDEWRKIYKVLDEMRPDVAKMKKDKWMQKQAAEKKPQAPTVPKAEPTRIIEPGIMQRAKEIWESGDALKYICDSIGRFHKGDVIQVKLLVLSYAAVFVKNTNGIYAMITGSTGKGKSDLTIKVLLHLPTDKQTNSRLSEMALYYHEIPDKSVISIDDQALTMNLQEVIKKMTTDFATRQPHRTLNKKGEPVMLYLPARCPIWITKVEPNGDEQILNRCHVVWIDESEEQDEAIRKYQNEIAKNPDIVFDTTTIEISKAIWEHMPKEETVVEIPYTDDIIQENIENHRGYDHLLDVIRASAIMTAPKRNRNDKGYIEASIADLEIACQIENSIIEGVCGSIDGSTKANVKFLEQYMADLPTDIYPRAYLQEIANISSSTLNRYLEGRKNKDGEKVGGLFEICPAISESNANYHGNGRDSRCKSVQWNREVYKRSKTKNRHIFAMNPERKKYWLDYEKARASTPVLPKN